METNERIKPFYSTWVVTVTYGDRHSFLRQVVDAALTNGVGKVIIVDNASSPQSRKAQRYLEKYSKEALIVLYLDENQGSAGGFKTGIEYAESCPECEFIWLLDDDNVPEEKALTPLFRIYLDIMESDSQKPVALLSLREKGRPHWRKITEGISVDQVFPRRSSFRGFHVLNFPHKAFRYIRRKFQKKNYFENRRKIKIPYGPWGGLFFHKSVLGMVGYPDERFYLYADDREFTYRFTCQGGGIYLIPESKVHDVHLSEHNVSCMREGYSHLLFGDSEFQKTYYLLRNNTYFQRYYWTDSQIVFTLNKWMFFLRLAIYAFKERQWKRFFQILNAVQEGERCQLGKRDKI